jgi:hypothetical protein
MKFVEVEDAQRRAPDGWLEITVPAGTRVKLADGSVVIVTRAGKSCGCGNGLGCPKNSYHNERNK